MSIGFKYASQTGWEKSHFGGFSRIIWDYPYVRVPDDLKLTPQTGFNDLTFYSAEKVLKMFFVAAKEHGIAMDMFDPKTAQIVEVQEGPFHDKKTVPKIQLTATTELIKKAIATVCSKETELAPLFQEYSDYIEKSDYKINVDFPEGKGEGEGEGEEGEGEEGEGEGEGEGKGQGKGEGEGQGEGEGDGEGDEGQGEGEGKGGGQSEMPENGKGKADDGSGSKGSNSPKSKKKEEKRDLEQQAKDAIEAAKAGDSGKASKIAQEIIKSLSAAVIGGRGKAVFDDLTKGMAQSAGYSTATGISTGCEAVPRFSTVLPGTKPAEKPQFEIKNAEMLLKMLDISFDTEKDIVKSLKMGKIDLSKIAEVPAGNTSIYQREMEDQTTKPFSICMLIDESGSMGRAQHYSEESNHMSRGSASYHLVKSLYHAFQQIIPQDKLFIYGHTGDAEEKSGPVIYTYHDPYSPNFERTISDMTRRRKGNNYDGPVVEAVHEKVRTFTDDRIIFIVLSDGSPAGSGYGYDADIQDFKRIVERAKRDDFVTAGVFVQYAGREDMYSYHTTVRNLDEMPKKVSHLLNKIVKTEFQ